MVLILTKPLQKIPQSNAEFLISQLIQHECPKAAECLRNRYKRYNEGVGLAITCGKERKVFIVAPDDTEGVHTLTRDPNDMERLYVKGLENGKKLFPGWKV